MTLARLTQFTARRFSPLAWLLSALVLAGSPLLAAESPEGVAVESGPHYAKFFGQQYRTKTDLYLFIFHTDTDHVYIGRRERRGLEMLPEKVEAANVGRTFGIVQILDYVPAGSVLTLLAETHETLRASGIRDHGGIAMGFIARLTHNGTQFEGVLTEFIQNAQPGAPRALNQRLDPAVVDSVK